MRISFLKLVGIGMDDCLNDQRQYWHQATWLLQQPIVTGSFLHESTWTARVSHCHGIDIKNARNNSYANHKMPCIHSYNILQAEGHIYIRVCSHPKIYRTSIFPMFFCTTAIVVLDGDAKNVGALQIGPRHFWWRLISSFVSVVSYHSPPATSHHHSQSTMASISGFHSI